MREGVKNMSYVIGWAQNPPDEDEEWRMMTDIAAEAAQERQEAE